MPTVTIAPAIARWLTASPTSGVAERVFAVTGGTVREVLDALFGACPMLRTYILDEHGTMRHHVVAFVNGVPIRDKQTLDDPVSLDGEVYVFQALSGG